MDFWKRLSREETGGLKDYATATSHLEGVDNRPLRMQIADALQNAILSGELRPGEPLVEAEIASRLGVSRGPVREAMQVLQTRNLIESVPYHGTKVRSLTRVDIEEVYSLRTVLETFAVRRVIAVAPQSVIDELNGICDAMQAAASKDDWRTVVELDDSFHRALIYGADHSLLANAWEQLDVRVRQIMALRNLRNDDIMQIFRNHVPIVESIERRDEASAVTLLEEHVASASDLMVEARIDDEVGDPRAGSAGASARERTA
jgi:DNA-binding GntR family transcriptional regulator